MSKKRWISAVVFLAIAAAFLYLWDKSFLDDSASYGRLILHELYTTNDAYEIAFVGASPVQHGIDPYVVDRELSCNSYNISTSAQHQSASYYLLRDAFKRHKIGTVVLNVSFSSLGWDGSSLQADYRVLDYMPLSLNKMRFSKDTTDRFLFERAAVRRVIYGSGLRLAQREENLKNTVFNADYHAYSSSKALETFDYIGKGFLANEDSLDGDYVGGVVGQSTAVMEKPLRYLIKSIALCRKNGANVILITAPYHPAMLLSLEEPYDDIHARIAAIAAEQGVPYWDFCMARDSELHLTNADFLDVRHLNRYGAEKLSVLLADMYRDYMAGADVSDRFYESWQARTREIGGVCGVDLLLETDREGLLTAAGTAYKPADMEAEYRFAIYSGDRLIYASEYGAENELLYALPADGVYAVHVYSRKTGSSADCEAAASAEVSVGPA